MESGPFREMDGGKNPRAKTERRGSAIAQSTMIRMKIRRHISTIRQFLTITLPLCDSAGFLGSKIGDGRKVRENISFRVEGSLPLTEISRRVAGGRRVCVLRVEVTLLSNNCACVSAFANLR